MITTKKPFSFRLSAQAQEHLDQIVAVTGMNQTAIVEYALAKMRAELDWIAVQMEIMEKSQL